MSSNIAFTLPFTVGGSKNVENYFNCDSSIERNTESTWAGPCVLRWTKTSEKNATLNSTGMNELFPNTVAKPISGYMSASIARTGLSGTSTFYGYVDGNTVLECTSKNTTYTPYSADMSAAVLNGASRSSSIVFSGKSSSIVNQTAASSVTVSLTFVRYDFSANAVNCSVSVSSSTGYDGDTVTFTASPNSACTFLGWYNGATRLTTSKTYTHTVNGTDLTLTARATDPPIRRRYLLWGNEIKLGDEINENFSVTYGSQTVVENLNGSKTLLCRSKYMADKVYLGTRSANCAARTMPKNLVAMVCKGDWLTNTALEGSTVGFVSSSGWCVTPFIPVPSGCTNISINAGGTQSGSILHEFDSNFGYLSYWGAGSNPRTFSFDYPSQICYVRATFKMSALADCYIKDNTHNTYIFRGGNV